MRIRSFIPKDEANPKLVKEFTPNRKTAVELGRMGIPRIEIAEKEQDKVFDL